MWIQVFTWYSYLKPDKKTLMGIQSQDVHRWQPAMKSNKYMVVQMNYFCWFECNMKNDWWKICYSQRSYFRVFFKDILPKNEKKSLHLICIAQTDKWITHTSLENSCITRFLDFKKKFVSSNTSPLSPGKCYLLPEVLMKETFHTISHYSRSSRWSQKHGLIETNYVLFWCVSSIVIDV